MNSASLTGKTILVIAGRPQETIDGVRFYANHARPESNGLHVADALEKLGATIVYITADTNAAALLEAAVNSAKREPVDVILQLASIASLKAAHISHTKLKIKTSPGATVPMDVVANIDVLGQLRDTFPATTILGYNNHQQWIEQGNEVLCHILRPLIQNTTQPMATLPTETSAATSGKLSGKKIIITSGPTVETLTTTGDVITNVSSGAQGIAVAEALADIGASITLISGPTTLHTSNHANINLVKVQSAQNMLETVTASLPADVYIGVAAVADFTLATPAPLILKEHKAHTLALIQNPDILSTVAHHPLRPALVIGFAAETDDLLEYASGKLINKGGDAICANAVDSHSRKKLGHGNNQITWLARANGTITTEHWPIMSKLKIGEYIGEKIMALLG